jgi:hypothetical protein
MTESEIIALVKKEFNVTFFQMQVKRPERHPLYAKFIAIMLMHEEGFKDNKIAFAMNCKRPNICNARSRFAVLIETKTEFKKMYQAVITKIAEMENELESEVEQCN